MSALESFLEPLDNVRVTGEGYTASCPVPEHGQGNGDQNPSLSVGVDEEGNVLVNCFAGCDNEAIVSCVGLTLADLFERRNGYHAHTEGVGPAGRPCTLDDYADYVKLPVGFLEGLGLSEVRYGGKPAVRMPYLDASGENALLTRFRVSLYGKPKVKTKKGDKHHLYGLWRLDEARKAGYCWLFEGESDSQTAWFHGEPAAGIPGANGWKTEWAEDLEGIRRLYFVVEDEAGEVCWKKLAATPEIRERLYRVELEGAKDVSELHKQDPEQFREHLETAREAARPAGESESVGEDPAPFVAPWPKLAAEALHGLAGDVVRAADPHTEADTVAVLVSFLVAVGNAIGRGAHFRVGPDRHYLKLFAGLVGETSKGRKGTSWGPVRDLMKTADEDWTGARVLGGLSSGEGLIYAVRDRVMGLDKDGEEKVEDEGVEDKRLLVIESELANVLKVMSRDGNTLSPAVRQAWDDERLQTLTKNSPTKATDSHISIIGHITKDELLRHMTETETANGFANRFLWLMVKRSKLLSRGGAWWKVDTADLVSRINEVLEFGGEDTEIRWGDSAGKRWDEIYGPLSEGKPGLFGAVVGRAEAQTLRLAALYAVLDLSRTIRDEHLYAALALWGYAESSARYIFGDATGDPVADQITDALREAGADGMTRTEVSNLFGRHKNTDRINRAFSTLLAAGRVRREKEETAGRPSERWFRT